MAGTARVLDYLPKDHPDRPRLEKLFREMADKVLTSQQTDGLWRASLLDRESYPLKETSGSGFFIYAFAWGVNNGLLDRAKFQSAINKGWAALVECVDADGKLTHVQPVGADPKKFDPTSSDVYGVGAFLLAGSEVYRIASGTTGAETK
jgi:rhamnogalacturonyl hydrolase YesR